MKLQLSNFKTAYAEAGKKIFAASYNVLASFGVISVTDPSFAGRKTGESGGEYIIIRDANGDQMIVGLINGTPKGANRFEIKQLEQIADFGEVKAGQKYFKAFAVVEEEE
jgi:hypothetical protein